MFAVLSSRRQPVRLREIMDINGFLAAPTSVDAVFLRLLKWLFDNPRTVVGSAATFRYASLASRATITKLTFLLDSLGGLFAAENFWRFSLVVVHWRRDQPSIWRSWRGTST